MILKYNPLWSGCNEVRHNIVIPQIYRDYFDIEHQEVIDLSVPFTRESWHGRMRACRGVGASLSPSELKAWEDEHLQMLFRYAPDKFNVAHYGAICVLSKKY